VSSSTRVSSQLGRPASASSASPIEPPRSEPPARGRQWGARDSLSPSNHRLGAVGRSTVRRTEEQNRCSVSVSGLRTTSLMEGAAVTIPGVVSTAPFRHRIGQPRLSAPRPPPLVELRYQAGAVADVAGYENAADLAHGALLGRSWDDRAGVLLIGVVVIGRSIQSRSVGRAPEPRKGILLDAPPPSMNAWDRSNRIDSRLPGTPPSLRGPAPIASR